MSCDTLGPTSDIILTTVSATTVCCEVSGLIIDALSTMVCVKTVRCYATGLTSNTIVTVLKKITTVICDTSSDIKKNPAMGGWRGRTFPQHKQFAEERPASVSILTVVFMTTVRSDTSGLTSQTLNPHHGIHDNGEMWRIRTDEWHNTYHGLYQNGEQWRIMSAWRATQCSPMVYVTTFVCDASRLAKDITLTRGSVTTVWCDTTGHTGETIFTMVSMTTVSCCDA